MSQLWMRGTAVWSPLHVLLFLLSRSLRERALEQPTLPRFIRRLELFLLSFLVMGLGYAYFEHASGLDATWLVWQTVTTVGYGDMPPKTPLGRLSIMGAGLAAILFLPFVVSAGMEYRDDRRLRRRLGMESNPFTDGYVLFNLCDEDQIRTIVHELRVVDHKAPVCIIADNISQLPDGVAVLPDIHFIRGSILDRQTYERARLRENRQVIVFPHEPGVSSADASTRVIVDKVLDFVGDATPVMHFLVDPDNAWLFEDCRSTSVYTGLSLYVAIQECHDRGSALIIQRLLSNVQGANPATFRPRRIAGWTWGDLAVHALEASRALGIPANPFALIKDGVPEPCPGPDERIDEASVVALIVPNGFQYAAFEDALVQARAASASRTAPVT